MFYIVFLITLSFQITAFAAPTSSSHLVELSHLAFNLNESPRIGFEIELIGLNTDEIAKIIFDVLGGVLEEKNGKFEYLDHQTKKYEIYNKKYFKVKRTKLGSLKVVPEDNGLSNDGLSTGKAVVTEIITQPLNYKQFSILDQLIKTLKAKGAKGTGENTPVSIQLNIEMGHGNINEIDIEFVIRLLRFYLDVNRESIDEVFQVPEIRQKYLGLFSLKMMERIRDVNYKPTAYEFYLDFMYRQSLEILEDPLAWDMPIDLVKAKLKNRLEANNFEVLLPIMKWNYIRLSSLLMYMFPNEWMTEYLLNTKWFKPYPIIEVREPNNNFNILENTEFILGLMSYLKPIQPVSPINYIEQHTGLLARDLIRLDFAYRSAENKPYVVRTYIADTYGEVDPLEDLETQYYFNHSYKRSTPIFLPANATARKPIVLPGESVVFHSLPNLGDVFRGKYNPGLENSNIAQILENKYFEYMFWSQYSKDAMAKTVSFADVVAPKESVESVVSKLNQLFEKGWVLKAVLSSATQSAFLINSSMDLVAKYKVFKDNEDEFRSYVEKIKEETEGKNPDIFTRLLRERKEFIGWVLHKMLKDPQSGIAQEKLEIKEEYRVEVIGGKVLADHSTIPRYQYDLPKDDQWRDEAEIKRVEDFVQSVVNQLPVPLRATPFGMDIAVLSNGDLKMIESNPQGNSGFLAYDNRSIKALDKLLKKYPELLASGELVRGLSSRNQMQYVKAFLNRIGAVKSLLDDGFIKTKSRLKQKNLAYPNAEKLPDWRRKECFNYLN